MELCLEDHAALRAHAKAEGFAGLATLLRTAGLADMQGSKRLAKEVGDELRELKSLISLISNNVNQMARHSNVLRSVVRDGEVLERLRTCEELLEDFVSAKLASP